MRRPTARVRNNVVLKSMAKLARQYLKWYGNASYKPHKNGEQWLLQRLRGEPIRTVLDVGANVGKWALIAEAALPDAAVHALEIVPATFQRLAANTAGRPRIRCASIGLADRDGALPIRYHADFSAHATFTDHPHSWQGEVIDCAVTTGDAFLRAQGLDRVDFLKIDVEGAEHLVLRGFAGSLAAGRVRFVQFEYGRANILTKFLLRDFHELFRGYGYVVGKIFPDFVDFREYTLDDEDFMGPNYLACAAGDPARPRLAPRGRSG